MSNSSQGRQISNAAIMHRRLCNSDAVAESLSETEIRSLKIHCFMMVSKCWREVTRALERGRLRDAHRIQARLFEGPAARLVAAWQADTKFRKRQRRVVLNLPPQSLPDIWQLAEQLKNINAPASVVVHKKTKRSGGYRLLHIPDRFGIAKQ